MVVVPFATPVTTPEALIVATAVVEDDHVPPATVLDNVDVPPIIVLNVPVIFGNAVTVDEGIAIVCVVAPVEVSEIEPLYVPAAAVALNLIYKVVLLTVPVFCVNVIEEVYVPPLVVDNSKPLGILTTILLVKSAPVTENVCAAVAVPTQA